MREEGMGGEIKGGKGMGGEESEGMGGSWRVHGRKWDGRVEEEVIGWKGEERLREGWVGEERGGD